MTPPAPPDEGRMAGEGRGREGEPIGPFPTWTSLYVAVVVYTAVLVAVLYVLSVTLDRGVR